jgi:glycogen debranching enzyme
MSATRHGTYSALDGNTFVVCDERGDVEPAGTGAHGVFSDDMRHLSALILTLDGQRLDTLSVDTTRYWALTFFLVPGGGTVFQNPTVSVIRERLVGDGLRERLTVENSGTGEIRPTIRLDANADFADIFDVKQHAAASEGDQVRSVAGQRLEFSYRREDFRRRTILLFGSDAVVDEGGASLHPTIAPGARWTTELEIQLQEGDRTRPVKYRRASDTQPKPNMNADFEQWLESAPTLETDWDALAHTYQQSLTDLAALRFYSRHAPNESLPAAGLPWFMALFGRDSIIASLQALPYQRELAATTLQVLAAHQAREDDPFRDAEPGKILHELRYSESVVFRERPQSPYYGSADATPLYLMLLDEYHRYTGDDDLVKAHRQTAQRALAWIDQHADRNGDGYIDYQRRNTTSGLENQCWKDSWNSIVFPDGSMTALPRATCELQGYAYAAKLACARLASEVWCCDRWSERLQGEAADLKRRFNQDYWIDEASFYALAIDGECRVVPTLTSNAGQLLFTGIVEDQRVDSVTSKLMGSDLYSGWGVRTMASGQAAFNPIEYHNGTVWPHDNSLIALGLARCGRREESRRIIQDLLDAAAHFSYRLPETFAGYPRSQTRVPVEYPSACSPQAWASGTPLLLLRTALDLDPNHERTVERELPNGRHVRLTWQASAGQGAIR